MRFFSLIVINDLSKFKTKITWNDQLWKNIYYFEWMLHYILTYSKFNFNYASALLQKKHFNFFEQIHIIIVLVNIIQNKECSHCFLCLKWKKAKCIENLSKWLNFSSRSHCRRLNIIFYDNSFPLSAVEYFYDYCCILF